jgi:hypothetical protein
MRASPPQPVGGTNPVLGAYPDVAVDAEGNAHVVYAHGGTLWYIRYDATSGTWQPPRDTGINGVASYRNEPDIALDSQSRPHVVGGTADSTSSGIMESVDGGDTWSSIRGSMPTLKVNFFEGEGGSPLANPMGIYEIWMYR